MTKAEFTPEEEAAIHLDNKTTIDQVKDLISSSLIALNKKLYENAEKLGDDDTGYIPIVIHLTINEAEQEYFFEMGALSRTTSQMLDE